MTEKLLEIPDDYKMEHKGEYSRKGFIAKLGVWKEHRPDLSEDFDDMIKWAESLSENSKIGWKRNERFFFL